MSNRGWCVLLRVGAGRGCLTHYVKAPDRHSAMQKAEQEKSQSAGAIWAFDPTELTEMAHEAEQIHFTRDDA